METCKDCLYSEVCEAPPSVYLKLGKCDCFKSEKDYSPVRHGRWERVLPSKSAAKWSSKVSCSICHNVGYERFKYCPNCGAKMDGGSDNG